MTIPPMMVGMAAMRKNPSSSSPRGLLNHRAPTLCHERHDAGGQRSVPQHHSGSRFTVVGLSVQWTAEYDLELVVLRHA
ncbi:hypothetical protein MBT84_09390 [Streptomyces sp. MBT84]|nr:hypothetical protein [Streptomyces sp. MBT84]